MNNKQTQTIESIQTQLQELTEDLKRIIGTRDPSSQTKIAKTERLYNTNGKSYKHGTWYLNKMLMDGSKNTIWEHSRRIGVAQDARYDKNVAVSAPEGEPAEAQYLFHPQNLVQMENPRQKSRNN
ncbi:hypothetical protein BB559_006063 [Furculomyces boomerangus]|uniref:Uncharacterized protein n=1 Tax=Furculomyces boomerangus TaxID=61424 RepID=A0A2T9Y4X6_9FUNG|nr:hypothetical protein BB559_006063 [Furculomyces boomerangus]